LAARTQNRLKDLVVRQTKKPGLHADGGGLYLKVDSRGGTKRWVFVFQWPPGSKDAKRREMSLGVLADVSLGEARDERDKARRHLAAGRDPVIERERERKAQATEGRQTFGEWAEEIAPAIGPKASKARKAWVAMMQEKVGDLAKKAPADITTEDVLKAVGPYWLSRPESGRRMRQRIERVLGAAKAKGLITDPTWQNPARLKDHLDTLLAKQTRKVKHRIALSYAEAPKFMAELRQLDRLAAACLEFVILTAVRNVEGRGTYGRELDLEGKLWVIPAERMKGEEGKKREHRVPLSDAAIAVVRRVWPNGPPPDGLVFPCPASRTNVYSENALQNVVNDMGYKGRAHVHGFRSTFKDWATECTNFANEVSEAALAHVQGDETERAYRRGDILLKRRKLMEAWAGYLSRPAGNVAAFSRTG
jgi:integrase